MLEVNKNGSIESGEHFKNILPKCGVIAGTAQCIGDNSERGICRHFGEKRFQEINAFKYLGRFGLPYKGKSY